MQLENKMLFKIIIYTCPIIRSYLTLCDPMDCSPPLSMGFPRQDYWSGLSFPSLVDLPNPGIKPVPLALQADSLPLSHQDKVIIYAKLLVSRKY